MTRTWTIAALALAIVVAAPGVAVAQFSCPVPASFTAAGFDMSAIVDASVAQPLIGADTTAGIFPGGVDGYNDFDDDFTTAVADARGSIPTFVLSSLVEAIISDVNTNSITGQPALVHDVVCGAFVVNANILDPVTICNSTSSFFDNASQGGTSKVSAATISWQEDPAGVQGVLDVGYDANLDGSSPCPEQPDENIFTVLGGAGNLLGDDGDVDGDGETNLEEWESAVDNNSTVSDDFDAAVAEFIANALAGTSIVVSVTGPGEILSGFSGTFNAVTVDPSDAMFTETHTFSSGDASIVSVVDAVNGVFQGVNAGTTTVIATGDTSTVSGTRSVSVRFAEWYEVCSIDEDIIDEGAGLVALLGCTLSGNVTNQFFSAAYDLDNIYAGVPAVPDYFQYALIAYTLCEGADANGPDGVVAQGEFATNFAQLGVYDAEAAALKLWTAPTAARVNRSPGSVSGTIAAGATTVTASTEDLDSNDLTGTYTFLTSNPAVALVDAGAAAFGVAGATGVAVTPGGTEGSATITIVDETFSATATVSVSYDDTSTNNASISGASAVNINTMSTYTAATVGPDSAETFTWSVTGGDASIGATTGVLSAGTVDTGITVTATGDISGLIVNKSVDVRAGTACDTAKLLFDAGDFSPTSGPIIDLFAAFGSPVAPGGFWDGPLVGGGGGGAYAQVVGAAGMATADALDAGAAGALAAVPLFVGLEELLTQFEALNQVFNNVAASLGMSSEMAAVTLGVLGGDAIFASDFGLPGVNLFNLNATALDALYFSASPASFSGGFGPGVASLAFLGGDIATVDAIINGSFLTNPPPAITPIVPDVIGSGVTKFGGFEPFSGESVFAPGVNPADLTNTEISDEVLAAGGDHLDFVAIAAGLGYFGPGGGIFLPVGGALMVGVLVGGMAFAGARRVRRQS